VRKNRTVAVPIEYMNQPAPRVVYAIATLTKRFHPDAYATANVTNTNTATTAPGTTAGTASSSANSEKTMTKSNGQPGFGVTSALVAIVGSLLFVRRWQ
jgi:iron complex transport system substrate-binding protein